LDQQVTQRQREVSDFEKKLHSESLRSREINNRTIANLENLIETERKRAQQAVDFVRQTLKAKIRVLEAQVEVDRSSDNSIKNDKRDVSRQLKNAKRKLDEKKSEVGRDKRKIEALTKQVAALKERERKLSLEISDLENEQHTLKRETSTLATQVEATQFSNAKLHVLVPTTVSTSIEEEASSKFPKPKEEAPSQKQRSEVRVPSRETYKPVEEKSEPQERHSRETYKPVEEKSEPQERHVEDTYKPVQEKPVQPRPEPPAARSVEVEIDSHETDFDKLDQDLSSQVDGTELGDIDDLVRETEGEHRKFIDPYTSPRTTFDEE